MNLFRRSCLFLCLLTAAPLLAQEKEVSPHEEAKKKADEVPYADLQVFARALQLIRQDYVSQDKVTYKKLIYSALQGMLSELDPHSQFMEPKEFKEMQEDTKSEFGGLGVMVNTQNGILTIVSPMEGAPGFQAGLLPGDQILKINGTVTEDMTRSEAIDILRGPPGQKVTLTIRRPAMREIKDYELTRAVIKVPSVRDARILPPEKTDGKRIGYIRISQFSEPTAVQLGKELDRLEKKGMDALVLDLRYNPGGLLNSAVDVCAQFLPPDTKVVYTEGTTPVVQRNYRTSGEKGKKRTYPIAVLINSGSASGSEIVAGALKDLRRAILVGETTFGKGSVQSVVSLPDGSAMRFTTARYFTPARQMIHEHGVAPNIRVPMSYDQEIDLMQARREAEISPKKKEGIMNGVADIQLDRAVDALSGALIYDERVRTEVAKKNP